MENTLEKNRNAKSVDNPQWKEFGGQLKDSEIKQDSGVGYEGEGIGDGDGDGELLVGGVGVGEGVVDGKGEGVALGAVF